MSLFGFGQSHLAISYNESLPIKNIEESTIFTISSDFGTTTLKGSQIYSYKFKKPGIYTIKVNQNAIHDDTCSHNALPSQIIVDVSRIRMKFDGSKLNFSSPIRKNAETLGIVLSVPVTIDTYDDKPILMDFTPVKSAGLDTSITATLSEKFRQLPPGKHLIFYALSGVVNENSYLMFDFIDANGKVQSVPLQTPIED